MLKRVLLAFVIVIPSLTYAQESNIIGLAKWVRNIDIDGGRCSALLYNYRNCDIMITAGHCMKRYRSGDTVYFSFEGKRRQDRIPTKGIVYKHMYDSVDVAVVKMLTDTIRNQNFILDYWNTGITIGETAYMFGFPQGWGTNHVFPGLSATYNMPIVRSGLTSGVSVTGQATLIILDISSVGQNSGGPVAVFDQRTGILRVIGFNKGKIYDFKKLTENGKNRYNYLNSGLSISISAQHVGEILSNAPWDVK